MELLTYNRSMGLAFAKVLRAERSVGKSAWQEMGRELRVKQEAVRICF